MNYNALTKIALFKSLTESDLENLLSEFKITESHFKKGEIIALQDEPCNRLIILISGKVKAEMVSPSGKIMKVEDIEAPNPLAILFLFGDDSSFPVEITALVETSTIIIPKHSVLKILTMNETILKNYLDISANYATRLSKKLNLVSLNTIRQKISMYVLDLSKQQQSDNVELNRPKTALAEYFGITRPSLERELTNMQNEGLIQSERKRIIIKDKGRLIRVVNN